MSSDTLRKETEAFLSFFSALELARPVSTIVDLSDGAALLQVLTLVDPEYFRQPTRPSPQLSDNWVLRFSALKRLYRLLTQYFSDVLNQFTSALEVPDLQAMAKDHNLNATLIMCRLTIAIAVQCENNKSIIEKIQSLSETNQHYLMKAIEQVMAKVQASGDTGVGEVSMTDDDHYYHIQSDRSRILLEKETLETVYQTLLQEHRTLQTNFDDVVSEKEEALARTRQWQREIDDSRRNDKSDIMMRAEMDRLRSELQKSEDNLAVAESDLDKQTSVVVELTRKAEELQGKAEEAVRLKDQVDEYRHAADKLQKTENVMEKYKKKLQEGADLRQQLKALEKQNADLVDKNASIEEEYRKVAAFKPLMESYKNQITELETKVSTKSKEIETVKFDLEQTRIKLKIANEERAKDSETLELYQERVRELELRSHHRPSASVLSPTRSDTNGDVVTEGESMAILDADDEDGLGTDLDTALSGTTMTDLKLQVKKLMRELEAVRKNEVDSSRILVLENLLEDANRMKGRYEAEYLAEHREKLVLQSSMEEIRSGKSMGDGAEAAIALRQRLNETVEQLDQLRREHVELEVKFETQQKELTIVKSDLTLVNKDQLDILASLRESVNEDKVGLEADIERLKTQLRDAQDKNKMQLEQINGLLFEKVSLQGEGIDQRERMIARERDFSALRRNIAGKDLPEDAKSELIALHEEVGVLKEQNKEIQEKLHKAKAFIKSQDKLFKEEQAKKGGFGSEAFEEAEASFRSQIKILEEDLARCERLVSDQRERYKKEHHLMLGVVHKYGMNTARDLSGSHLQQQARGGPSSWLGQQRNKLGQQLRR